MTVHKVLIENDIEFVIHNCDYSLELTELLIYSIKTFPNSLEFNNKTVQNILNFLSPIDIFLSKEKNSSAAVFRDKQILFFVNTILEQVKEFNQQQRFPIIQQAIIHEATHLYHDEKTQYLQRFNERRYKLKKKLQPSIFGKIIPINFSNYKRDELFDLLNLIFCEGLTMYVENIEKDIDIFQLQNQCKSLTIQIKQNFINYEKTNKIETDRLDKYYIGLLMTHLILNDTKLNISFEQLSCLGFKQFIELYEKAAQNKGFEILVSYSSNKGILDYQSLIKFWKQEKRNSKK